MTARGEPFAYALVRVVPRVDRGECFNAGVLVFCRRLRFLAARTALDDRCLAALAPDTDADAVRAHLVAVEQIAAGDPHGGPVAALDQSARFHWLTAPSSTVVQTSEVHTGLTDDPARALHRLFTTLVARE